MLSRGKYTAAVGVCLKGLWLETLLYSLALSQQNMSKSGVTVKKQKKGIYFSTTSAIFSRPSNFYPHPSV